MDNYNNASYYTLQAPTDDPLKNDVYPEKFHTYEEAYDKMCDLYIESKELPFGIIVRYGIYRTTETDYNGSHNKLTQPVWNK